jgi:hypothetical protein
LIISGPFGTPGEFVHCSVCDGAVESGRHKDLRSQREKDRSIMSIEPFLIFAAPICSVCMVIWVSLFFAKSPKLVKIKFAAFKIWAIALLAIFTALAVNGVVWNIEEHGSLSMYKLGLGLLIFLLPLLFIKLCWDLIKERR